MRTSSIKSVVSALSIVATLALAVPSAQARAAQPAETRIARSAPSEIDRAVRAIQRLVKRLKGIVATGGGPSVPIPPPTQDE